MLPLVFPSIEAATAARKGMSFDVLLIDHDLLESGLSAIRQVTGQTPTVIFYSLGRKSEGLAEQLIRQGHPASLFLAKPVKPSLLCEALLALLAGEPAHVPQRPQLSAPDPTFAERFPYRILVAEDHPVNQTLTLLLLSRLGFKADVANNGWEAFEAVRKQNYDVVFMDMHMPALDGIGATRHILQFFSGKEAPWIIALTANAMKSDKDLCLEAGMRDFVSKPVELEDLRRALERVPGRLCPPMAMVESQQREFEQSKSAPAEWCVPEALEQALTEDFEFGKQLIEMFIEDAAERLATLREKMRSGETKAARDLLHSMKGSCRQIGALTTAEIAAQMEQGISSEAGDQLTEQLRNLAARFASTRTCMEEYLASYRRS